MIRIYEELSDSDGEWMEQDETSELLGDDKIFVMVK